MAKKGRRSAAEAVTLGDSPRVIVLTTAWSQVAVVYPRYSGAMLYLIGGPPRAGKATLAAAWRRKYRSLRFARRKAQQRCLLREVLT